MGNDTTDSDLIHNLARATIHASENCCVDRNTGDSDRHNQRVENIYLNAGELPNRSSHYLRTAAIFRGVRWRHMVFKIYRAGDLHNKPGKPGIFNVGRTHFYDVIEPRLEKPASAIAPSATPIAASSASRPR